MHLNTVHACGDRELVTVGTVLSSTYWGGQTQPRLYQTGQNLVCTV